MPHIRFQEPGLLVNISDKVVGNSRIKRKAHFIRLMYSNAVVGLPNIPNSQDQAIVHLAIEQFSAGEPIEGTPDFAYGESLKFHPGFQPYLHNLVADNNSLVNSDTGAVIGSIDLLNNASNSEEGGPLHGVNYIYEGEFFRRLARLQPVIVDQLISQYISTAIIP